MSIKCDITYLLIYLLTYLISWNLYLCLTGLDIQPPKEWTAMKDQDLDVIRLEMDSPEYANIAGSFMQSLGKPNVQIVKVSS